jgi:hypothetical protein
MCRQVFLLSVPDPTDYEGPNRWVFPTEDNYFVQDMVKRIAGIGIAEDLQQGDDPGAKGAPVLKRRCTFLQFLAMHTARGLSSLPSLFKNMPCMTASLPVFRTRGFWFSPTHEALRV